MTWSTNLPTAMNRTIGCGCRMRLLVFLLCVEWKQVLCFVEPGISTAKAVPRRCLSMSTSSLESLGLTPELEKMTTAFESIGDDKLRYKQLLYMANNLEPLQDSSRVSNNLVPGCLSTVYVDGVAEQRNGETIIHFKGDSDGLLTKGLVALLIRGLSGNTAEAIQKVDPAFIEKAGIAASLTPGRNNGFLNMLSTLKQKALQLAESETESEEVSVAQPTFNSIITILQKLKPTELNLVDVSAKHAGHKGAQGLEGEETHFELYIVSSAFDGLPLVQRHKLIYLLLGEVMPKIHALQIKSLTPEEV